MVVLVLKYATFLDTLAIPALPLAVIPTATLRMQRVGINGAGSLKILVTSERIQSADEPGAMALFGFGLIGLYLRRRSAQLSAQRAA